MTRGTEDDVRDVLEVGCDESGSDGENLTGGNTDVFAHASVDVPVDVAAAYLLELRSRIRSPATEYKANHLLREKHRPVLEALLAPSGPLYGRAHVHLTEKAYLIVDRAVDLLLDDTADVRALYRRGRREVGDPEWGAFLAAANRLLRVRGEGGPPDPVEAFFRALDALRRADRRTDGPGSAHVTEILGRLAGARSRAGAYRARVELRYPLIPALNPMLPAIVHTAAHWSRGGRTVRLIHDRQNMLTPDRIAWIEEAAVRRGAGFGGMELVQAGHDPRIQFADFLAGIARKIADDVLAGRPDAELVALLRPYVGPTSVWGDEESWALLGPRAGDRTHAAPSSR
ncbi:hypothetical protein ACIPSE_23370 [Streptomyces sp. NPDC090106]|uniref:hypothetical protein n=1 Tax=Streptomyces sp. NPDC090106 TaxID=3365946 RepID=UPI0038225870